VPKDKSKNRCHKSERVFVAEFENGVSKPLAEIRLPKRKKLTVIVRTNDKSIASQMYGLFRNQNQTQVDEIVESDGWL
jgi:predicted DNA-binding antitoxin AbrB/MazE fold protein